jgi:UDP-N-acetylmuramate dehydrogenase
MMAARSVRSQLLDRLPLMRGSYEAMANLGGLSWFRIGGPAEVLFTPADVEDLSAFLKACPGDAPVTVIGLGSNMLVRDGGVPGVVVRLGKAFSAISVNENILRCGAGIADASVSTAARDAELTGLEFLTGIPGTIGGALRMNAGAYGCEIKDVFVSATALDGNGNVQNLTAADMGFVYRSTEVDENWIFIGAELRGEPGDKDAITTRIREIRSKREAAQPTQALTGGSTFANPPGQKAWTLIDDAGCRGLTIGGARVSEKHTNFLINTGAASANDIETLGDEVRRRVMENTGIDLHWEIRRIGVTATDPNAIINGGAS